MSKSIIPAPHLPPPREEKARWEPSTGRQWVRSSAIWGRWEPSTPGPAAGCKAAHPAGEGGSGGASTGHKIRFDRGHS